MNYAKMKAGISSKSQQPIAQWKITDNPQKKNLLGPKNDMYSPSKGSLGNSWLHKNDKGEYVLITEHTKDKGLKHFHSSKGMKFANDNDAINHFKNNRFKKETTPEGNTESHFYYGGE